MRIQLFQKFCNYIFSKHEFLLNCSKILEKIIYFQLNLKKLQLHSKFV